MRQSTALARVVSYGVRWEYHCLSGEAAILGKLLVANAVARDLPLVSIPVRFSRAGIVKTGSRSSPPGRADGF